MAHKRLIFLYKRYLLRLLYNPFAYFLVLFFIGYSVIAFFVGQNFFMGAGSTDLHRFFSSMASVLVLIMPAMTAMLPSFDSEWSFPFSDASIVALRWSAVLSVCLVPVILTLPVPLCVNTFGDVDVSLIVCGYLGIIFYLFTGIAASIFLFALCNTVILALTLSVLLFLLINNAHLIAVSVDLPNWIVSLFKVFSFEWHFDASSKGIIDSRDLLFYASSSIFFTGATVMVLKRKRGLQSPYLKKLTVLTVATYILLLLNSYRYFFRIDATVEKKFSITPYSSVLLSEVEDPLKITYYLSPVLRNLYPQVRDVDDFLQTYAGASHSVFYELVDPVKTQSEKILASHGIRGEQIQTASDSTTSYTTVYSAIVIQYLENTEIIPFVLDTKTLEYDMTSRIQYIVRGIARNVQVVIGNGLSLDSDYSYVKPWLESQGFSVFQTCFPSQAAAGKTVFFQIPEVPLLVLGSSECTREDAEALSYFLQRGGKAFIASAPYRIDIKNDWSFSQSGDIIKDNVLYMLQQFGIYVKDSMVADESCFSLSLASADEIKTIPYSLWPVLQKQKDLPHGMTVFWPCAIEIAEDVAAEAGVTVSARLHTSKSAWLVEADEGSVAETNPFTVEQTAPNSSDQFDVCVELQKDGRATCIVFGDQYAVDTNLIAFTSSNRTGGNGQTVPLIDDRSLHFLTDSLLQLSGQTELLALKNKSRTDTSLYKTRAMSVRAVFCVTILLPAFVLLLCAIIVHVQRCRFNKEEFV